MLDKFRETAITWDKANRKVYEPLRVSAGDNKGRKLSVQVVNGGVVENITGSSLSLFWETRDKAHRGLDVFTAVDATKGEFEIYYTTGMLSNEGVLNANLVLVDTSGRVVSEPFTITVFKGIDDNAIQSSDSFTALTEALIDISDLEQNYAPRLNDLTAQLQQTKSELAGEINKKPDRGNISVTDINKNLGKFDQSFMSDEFLSQLTGDSPINAVPADNSITSPKLANGAITNEKLHPYYSRKGKFTGSDLNLAVEPGSYEVLAETLNNPTNSAAHLIVFAADGGWTTQIINDLYRDSDFYIRNFRYTNGSVVQVREWEKINKEVPSLFSMWRDENDITSGDLNEIRTTGSYQIINTGNILNLPDKMEGSSAHLMVFHANGGWTTQIINPTPPSNQFYIRNLRVDHLGVASGVGEWQRLTNEVSSNDIVEVEQKLKVAHNKIQTLESRDPFAWKPFDKAYITIVWDDGRRDLDKVWEVWSDYPELPFSMAIPSDRLLSNPQLNGTSSQPFLRDLVGEILSDSKNELLGHGKTGGAITENRSPQWVDDELGLAKLDYIDLGYDVRGSTLSGETDPEGVYSADNYDDVGYGYIAKRYYDYGDRLAYDAPYNMGRRNWNTSYANRKAYIDEAVADNQWISFFAHTMDGSEAANVEQSMREILDYIVSLGVENIEFTTYRHMYETFGSSELRQRLETLENQ